jgi:cytokinesis protein
MHAVINLIEDLDLRLHHRSLMESAGLQRIIELCQSFGMPIIDLHLRNLQKILDDDERQLRERLDQAILHDLKNPQDVFNAIFARTRDTKAQDYFLSVMRHLLLIREEGQPMVHYYRLIDSLVTDVVMDKKLAGVEQRMGHSVEQIIAQFNEADRYQAAEAEAAEARATAVRLKLEKETLEAEIAQGQDGLVGSLKLQLERMEEKLNVSRETTSRLQGQLVTQRAGYEEQIAQLEAQIMELFRMLKEVGKGVETILDGGAMDRRTLVQQLEKDFQRRKTISILEGREGHRRRANKANGNRASIEEDAQDDEDVDATPIKGSLRRSKPAGTLKKAGKAPKGVAVVDENGRVSQFMDADDEDAQEQIQQQLAAGVNIVCRQFSIRVTNSSSLLSVFTSHGFCFKFAQYTSVSSSIGTSTSRWRSTL